MTSQEARQQVNAAENQINGAFSNLKRSANSMAQAAVDAASKNTLKKTLIPLIACLVGLLLCVCSLWGWGIALIIIGAIVSYNMHASAKTAENKIIIQQRNLNDNLERFPRI